MTNDDVAKFSKLLDEKLAPIQQTLDEHGKMLQEHGKQLQSLQKGLTSVEKGLTSVKKELSSVKKDQGTMLNMLDKEQMDQRKRLKRVEDHLTLTPTP
jgi:septation ring formation regulator EzrA